MLWYFLIVISFSFLSSSLLFNFIEASDDNQPLFITKYLNSGEMYVESIQQLAAVKLFEETHQSYSGFFTVDSKCSSNLFFWFFKSPTSTRNKPVVLWLQGGPGSTFLTTLFDGNGPYRFQNDVLIPSDDSWTKDFNMLYIDNPVGTGFSFTDDNETCYSLTVNHAADNLYKALKQFYSLFPEYENNELYLAGESYGGKYISVLAGLISWRNEHKRSNEINLQGLFIGCGFIDPQNQLYYADPLFEMGVIDEEVREKVRVLEVWLRKMIKQGKDAWAAYYLSNISLTINSPRNLLYETTGNARYLQMKEYIQRPSTRSAIHVGSLKFHHSRTQVLWYFRKDFFKSARRYLSKAVRQYKVLLYSGQQDTFIPPKQIDHVISALEWWTDLRNFNRAERQPWYVEGELAGYKKSFKNLTQVEVQQANHYIVQSQPKWMSDLFKSFVHDELYIE